MTIYYLIRCFKRSSQGQQQVGPAMTLDGQPVYQVAYGGQAKQTELVVMQQGGGQQMYAPQGGMAPMYAPQQQQQQQQAMGYAPGMQGAPMQPGTFAYAQPQPQQQAMYASQGGMVPMYAPQQQQQQQQQQVMGYAPAPMQPVGYVAQPQQVMYANSAPGYGYPQQQQQQQAYPQQYARA
jgi:hypothetical protein